MFGDSRNIKIARGAFPCQSAIFVGRSEAVVVSPRENGEHAVRSSVKGWLKDRGREQRATGENEGEDEGETDQSHNLDSEMSTSPQPA